MKNLPWRAIRTIIWKDLTVVLRSPMVLLPMIILPLLLQVLMPVGLGLGALYAPDSLNMESDLVTFLEQVPAGVMEDFQGLPFNVVMMVLMLEYLFAPLYLLVPMMVASVIAADSFVGERERKTLEALLHTPLSDLELLISKMLTAWIAANVVSVGSFLLYSVAVNAVGFVPMGGLFFPNTLWLVLVFWVTPAVAALGLASTVLLSSRVNTFQEAYQAGGVIVVPIVGLLFAQIAGVIFLSPIVALILGLVVWMIDAVLLWLGRAAFRREDLLARL
ncbi:MAG: ABC transporter permease subunit [Anaerolineales bacterium]